MALLLVPVNRKTFFDEKTSIVCVDLQVPSNNTYIYICVYYLISRWKNFLQCHKRSHSKLKLDKGHIRKTIYFITESWKTYGECIVLQLNILSSHHTQYIETDIISCCKMWGYPGVIWFTYNMKGYFLLFSLYTDDGSFDIICCTTNNVAQEKKLRSWIHLSLIHATIIILLSV